MGELLSEKTRFFIKDLNERKKNIGYHNCLPIVQKYKTLTKNKEDLVQLCVNQIEERKERDSLLNTSLNGKPMIKFLFEDPELELSNPDSQSGFSPPSHIINLEQFDKNVICGICYCPSEKIEVGICRHTFCRDCLKTYLENLVTINKV